MKKIAILGSTGSVGKQTIDIIRKDKKNFKICLLTANKNHRLLSKQKVMGDSDKLKEIIQYIKSSKSVTKQEMMGFVGWRELSMVIAQRSRREFRTSAPFVSMFESLSW